MKKSPAQAVASYRRSRPPVPPSVDELVEDALPRVDHLLAEGVTTLEIKSGYGLDIDTELNMLRAARRIAAERPVEVKTTFLGAHAVPADYKDRADAYIDDVCIPALELAHKAGLVDAVDGFCEGIAFTPHRSSGCFVKARELGLPVKLHAEQLSNLGGAKLAAKYGALSADHLEYLDEDGVRPWPLPARWQSSCPARSTRCAKRNCRQSICSASTACADGGGDRLQPRLLADDIAAADHEHGLHPVSHDAGRSVGWRTRNAAKALGLMMRHHRAGQAGRPVRCGMSSTRQNCPTGSVSTRCISGCFQSDK
jgi:hypothetical protein